MWWSPTIAIPVVISGACSPWVKIPKASEVRPASYLELAAKADALKGQRLGVPRMFINKDELAGTSENPVSAARPVSASIPSDRDCPLGRGRKALEAAGAEVIEVDFPWSPTVKGTDPARPPCSIAAS